VARAVSRAARQSVPEFGRYALGAADLAFRQEIAKRLARCGCMVSPEEIVVTNGCMEALNLAVRAVAAPGDTVAVESPTYFGILEMIESLGMRSLAVPTTCRLGLDLDVFEKSLRKFRVSACLFIPSFGNPNGACMSNERRERLSAILEKRGIPLIEDDIYGDLHFDEERPRPVKAFGDGAAKMLCGSFSKTLSPGLRLGWVAAGRHAEDVRRLKLISSIATSQIISRTGQEFLQSGTYDRHLRRLRRNLENQVKKAAGTVFQSFPEGTAVSRPRGGYFLWVELPGHIDSMQLRDAAKKRRISICPGPIFSTEPGFRNYLRLNCAIRWGTDAERAIWTLGEMARDIASVRPSGRAKREALPSHAA
jgi:DNA-binding transcriptional MocR family regulator